MKCRVVVKSSSTQVFRVVLIHSGPLSIRITRGRVSRCSAATSRSSTTSVAVIVRPALKAICSRVNSSTILQIFMALPEKSESNWKSSAHTSLGHSAGSTLGALIMVRRLDFLRETPIRPSCRHSLWITSRPTSNPASRALIHARRYPHRGCLAVPKKLTNREQKSIYHPAGFQRGFSHTHTLIGIPRPHDMLTAVTIPYD